VEIIQARRRWNDIFYSAERKNNDKLDIMSSENTFQKLK
jgi:hypothetical protein